VGRKPKGKRGLTSTEHTKLHRKRRSIKLAIAKTFNVSPFESWLYSPLVDALTKCAKAKNADPSQMVNEAIYDYLINHCREELEEANIELFAAARDAELDFINRQTEIEYNEYFERWAEDNL